MALVAPSLNAPRLVSRRRLLAICSVLNKQDVVFRAAQLSVTDADGFSKSTYIDRLKGGP